jgi:hypothetical protein
MSLCQCAEKPVCAWRACNAPADWSMMLPVWRERHGAVQFVPKFTCELHRQEIDALRRRIPGLDPSPSASPFDQWRPSLTDMVRIADIEISRQDRKAVG